jgi:hypothetical protein
MVLLRESGMTQPAIAEAMGVSLSTVNRAHMAYDHGGLKALKPKPIGGRQRENMTLAEETALLNRFAKAAGAGEMLNIHDLKAAYEKAIGHVRIANHTSKYSGAPTGPNRFAMVAETAAEAADAVFVSYAILSYWQATGFRPKSGSHPVGEMTQRGSENLFFSRLLAEC